VQSRFGAPGLATRYLITQNNFNAWAESVKPRTRALTAFFLMLVAVACSAAIIVMAPRLARESALLWFGKHAEGVIKSADVIEVGKFKGGDPKYRLRLAYEFPAEDGTAHAGLTQRDDIRTPPGLKPGDAIGVYYSAATPTNSVADYNLRTDVYALLLFLPWIALFGILGPLFYLYRWRQWRRAPSTLGHTEHTSGA